MERIQYTQTYFWKMQVGKGKRVKIIYGTTTQRKTVNILIHFFTVLINVHIIFYIIVIYVAYTDYIFYPFKTLFYKGYLGRLSWLSYHLLILAQVMISGLVSSSPTSGSTLTVRSLLGILFLPLLCSLSLSLSLSK